MASLINKLFIPFKLSKSIAPFSSQNKTTHTAFLLCAPVIVVPSFFGLLLYTNEYPMVYHYDDNKQKLKEDFSQYN